MLLGCSNHLHVNNGAIVLYMVLLNIQCERWNVIELSVTNQLNVRILPNTIARIIMYVIKKTTTFQVNGLDLRPAKHVGH